MCTVFPYCRISVQRLLAVIHTLIATGGFMAGPWTLRPKRLRWLTTSAANRQVRPPDAYQHQSYVEPEAVSLRHARHKHADGGHRAIWSSGRSAMPAKNAAFLRLLHRHPGASRGLKQIPAFAGMTRWKDSRALAPSLFTEFCIGSEPGGSFPSCHHDWESGVHLR